MKVMVFETTMETEQDVAEVEPMLQYFTQITDWSIDLNDCDRVLRIESENHLFEEDIVHLIERMGYTCKKLESCQF